MYSVLIVDDEPMARAQLCREMSSRSEVCDVQVAEDAIEALEKLTRDSFDVIFLDIKMPEMSGIELADTLHRNQPSVPSIVFTTAHDEFAVAAFERHAVDYVLKPFSSQRVQAALDTALQRRNLDQIAAVYRTWTALGHFGSPAQRKIAVKDQGRVRLIDAAQIQYVEAEGNYVLFHLNQGTLMIRDTMTRIEQRLEPLGFIRIHRSAIVNRDAVAEYYPWYTGEYVLKLHTGKELTVSRTFKHKLSQLSMDSGAAQEPCERTWSA